MLYNANENIRARRVLTENTLCVDKRFESGLLWTSVALLLPDSYDVAYKRLIDIMSQKKCRKKNYVRKLVLSGIYRTLQCKINASETR